MTRAVGRLALLLLLWLPTPAGAEPDPAALRAELQELGARYRAVQAELREAIARVQAIGADAPMAERRAEADRLLRLRETLDRLGEVLEAKRQQIATLPDWYVVRVEGAGVSTMRSSLGGFLVPELQRLRGFEDVEVRVDPGRQATEIALEAQRALAPPACRRPGSPLVRVVSTPEFWEDLKVFVAAGPFATRAEAGTRRRPGTIGIAEVIPYPNPNALLRQFGCPEHPMARVRVAEVSKLPLAEAEARLEAQGLVPVGEGGDPAPSAGLAFTVQTTRPGAGVEVDPGSRVAVRVYSPPAPGIAIPDLQGLPFDEAERRLAGLGLRAERADAGPPPARQQAGAVARQEPQAGAQLPRGAAVRLGVHGVYTPTRDEQVAATQCPANSQPFWDAAVAAPRCRCAAGFVSDGRACVVDRQAAVAGLRCPPNAQPYWDEGASQAQCRCAAGFVASGGACVMDRNAAVAAMQCPLFAQAYWDEQAGRAQCRCMAGYAWSGVACLVDRGAAVAALQCPANSEGHWDEGTNRAQCRCRGGFVWNGQACIIDRQAAVAGLRCPANSQPYWDEGAGRAQCRCTQGYVPSGQSCVLDRAAAVAALRCPANAEGYWDDRSATAQCRCRHGHSWNGQACVTTARQQPTPPPPPSGGINTSPGGRVCPPGQVAVSDGVLGMGNYSCVRR